MKDDRIRVQVDGRELEVSNLDKVMFPAVGFTKGEVIDYYTRVSEVLLPHLRDRALTRIRCTPNWVRLETLPVPGSSKERETLDFVIADDLPTLVWLANLAALELHTPQWRIGEDPDLMVVDLDPGAPAGLTECCEVAVMLRERLAQDGLDAYPKTSGKKGMQLSCPIAGTSPADDVSGYAKRIAEEMERRSPRTVTSKMAKRLRPGKIFIDWSQNNAAKTTVAPYSMRAQPVPTVSTPLTWEEVEAAAAGEAGAVRQFRTDEVLSRIEEYGDLLEDLLTPGPELPGR
jgi:bifunctional non-homologous end joining protein LigD